MFCLLQGVCHAPVPNSKPFDAFWVNFAEVFICFLSFALILADTSLKVVSYFASIDCGV